MPKNDAVQAHKKAVAKAERILKERKLDLARAEKEAKGGK